MYVLSGNSAAVACRFYVVSQQPPRLRLAEATWHHSTLVAVPLAPNAAFWLFGAMGMAKTRHSSGSSASVDHCKCCAVATASGAELEAFVLGLRCNQTRATLCSHTPPAALPSTPIRNLQGKKGGRLAEGAIKWAIGRDWGLKFDHSSRWYCNKLCHF